MIIILLPVVLFLLLCFITIEIKSASYSKKWTNNFELEVAFSEEQAAEGDTLYLYETITNNKDMILPAVCVRFKTSRFLKFTDLESGTVSDYFYRNDILSVRGYEKVRRKLKFKCMRRGIYSINEAELVGHDYFLRRKYIEKRELNASLIVYPSFVDVKRIIPVFQKSYGELSSNMPMFEDPFEYIGVRDYVPGDAMSRINWKASARTGIWQVRTSAYTASEPALILLNLESPGTFTNYGAMEENIKIAYSLVYFLDQRGITTTLAANDREGLRVSGNGRGHIANVRRLLATISYEKQTRTGAEFLQRELEKVSENQHVFFISAAGKKEIQQKVAEFVRRGCSVTWTATISGGEDDTKDLMQGMEKHMIRWKV